MRVKATAERAGAAVAAAAVAVLAALAAGCGRWPWHHQPAAPAAPVHELDIGGANAEAFQQYWKRNTLVVDLSAVSGSGSITLKPVAGAAWPVRLALRITPGSIGALDVEGAQRLILPVNPSGGKPVDLELTPGVYTPSTPQLTVQWGPAGPPQT